MPANAVRVLRFIANEEQTDADLLRRFIDRRDEVAFAVLVSRHAPMVWGVCRRVLSTDQDAEDAFQATFLVLIQKALGVPPEAVGNWLYGVARRAALLARRAIARRRERVGDMTDLPAPEPLNELRAVLDEELNRLPDIYRAVVVLCDLEGRSRREAAAALGWPEGTVAGRLSRAREMLAKRLARHAPVVSVAALLAGTASARVPEVFAMSAAVPSGVAALAQEVLGAMIRGKLMKTAVVVLLLVCAGFGVAIQAGQIKSDSPKETPAPPGSTEARVPPPKADQVVWGDEVNGLQAGLVLKDAQILRHGEKLKLEVRLRNTGKADIKIRYVLLKESAPVVTNAKDGHVTVAMPPSPRYYVPPTERVIKPGEMVDLYAPEVAVETADLTRMDGEMRVQTPTMYAAPGTYKISFGGMLTSHPKLATGSVAFEVKDPVVWGKEVDGLQAGVVGPAPVRVGETARFAVKLRNVGKAEIKVAVWPHWMHAPGVVDAAGKHVRGVSPPIPLYKIAPKTHTIQPGQTIDLGKADVAIAGEDLPDRPDPPVQTFTIRGVPGKLKISFGGFIQDRPELSTGGAEVEVREAADLTAWGKEAGGLQAGLEVQGKREYRHGETITLLVRVRNVSKEAVKFGYIRQYLDEKPPSVTGADGKVIPQKGPSVEGLRHVPIEVSLEPGKEMVLETRIHGASGRPYELRPADGGGTPTTRNSPLRVGTGKITLQYERVFGNSSIGRLEIAPALAELATGKLELEVTEAAQSGSIFVPTHDGMRELKGKEAEAYQTTNAWLAERLKEANSIKVGSTYADVCKHFHIDGGLSEVGKNRFVLILCPYIKIDVEFEPVKGNTLSPTTKVIKVSRPYFEPAFLD